jgi:RNA polymerase sigma-70 factor (ECF subfamily)
MEDARSMASDSLTIGMRTALAQEELVREAQAYSDQAWAAIFDENYSKMLDYCYLRTGNRTTAEDLASEVFLEALRGIKRYQFRGVPFSAWLYRIAHHLTVDHLRRSARRPTVTIEATSEGRPELAVADEAPKVDAQHDLQQALRTLTDDQQQVLMLRFFHGLSHEETAAIMNRRPVAVRVLQNRALKSLRKAMAA